MSRITRYKNTGHAGLQQIRITITESLQANALQVRSGQDEAALVAADLRGQPLRLGRCADEDEH